MWRSPAFRGGLLGLGGLLAAGPGLADDHGAGAAGLATLETLVQVHAAPGVTEVQRARAYLYMGVCFTALGNPQNAIAAFVEVLRRRPDFRMPDGVSPSIRAMFEEAVKQVPQQDPGSPTAEAGTPGAREVELIARASSEVVLGRPVKVKIEIDDPKKQVGEVVVLWRRRRGPDYSRIQIKREPGQSRLEAVIPAAALGDQPGPLTFFVEARDAKGKPLATAGTEEDPYEVMLRQPEKPKSRTAWWLVIGGAATAVAGGVLAAVLLTRDSGGGSPVPPSTARLTVILK